MAESKIGKVVQVIGPVVDIKFDEDSLPNIYNEIKIDKNGFIIVDGNKTKDFWNGKIHSIKTPLRLKIRNICGDETIWVVE